MKTSSFYLYCGLGCIAGQTIQLKRARVAWLDNIPDHANLTLQALSYLGRKSVDDQIISRCARMLTDKDLVGLHRAMERIPGWMADAIHKIENVKHGQILYTA